MAKPRKLNPTQSFVLTVGGTNRDEIVRLSGPLVMSASNPVTISETSGGVARNVAHNLAALGVASRLLTAIGDDLNGGNVLALTAAQGIDTSFVIRMRDVPTGRYTAVLDASGNLVLGLADMTAIERLSSNDISAWRESFEQANAVFIDTNLEANALSAAVALAAECGVPAMVDMVSPAKCGRLRQTDLARVGILVGNRNEASAWLGTTDSAQNLAAALVAKGARSAIVSDGERPLGWCDGYASGALQPSPVKIINVTGAGDALHAGVIAARLSGAGIEEAARSGLDAALSVVTSKHHALDRAHSDRNSIDDA